MDPFSHFLLAYLITFGVWGPAGLQYVTAGALAGGLPDGDVLLYPLSKRFPLLRHRGISHSILGVTVIAAAGAVLVPPLFAVVFGATFAAGSPFVYFAAMELGGLSHIFLDSLDHWSVPIFAPFSPVEYHFDVDRIFNLGAMVFTVVAYGTMLYERGRAPLWLWQWTAWVLLALATVYFVVRITARWRAGVARRRLGFTDVIPQFDPFRFLLVDERSDAAGRSVRYASYHLLRGVEGPIHALQVSTGPEVGGPVTDAPEALRRSYAPALAASWVLGETHHFGEVRERPDAFDVHWYSLEMVVFGRAGGVLATVDKATGRVAAHPAWRPFGPPA